MDDDFALVPSDACDATAATGTGNLLLPVHHRHHLLTACYSGPRAVLAALSPATGDGWRRPKVAGALAVGADRGAIGRAGRALRAVRLAAAGRRGTGWPDVPVRAAEVAA